MARKKSTVQVEEPEIIEEVKEVEPNIIKMFPSCMLNVREDPTIESKILRVVSPSEMLEMYDEDCNGFMRLTNGGYVMSQYLTRK